MDLNIRIIEAVKECPALYKCTKFNSATRKQNWKLVAEKLQLQEQFLKIRWHSLVQRYQADLNFKYNKQMNFLKERDVRSKQIYDAESKVDTSVVNDESSPEFIITENDLLPATGGNYDYVFVEVEELANVRDMDNRKVILEDHLTTHQKLHKKYDNPITTDHSSNLTTEQRIPTKQTNNSLEKEKENLVEMAEKSSGSELVATTPGKLESIEATSDMCILSNKNSNSLTVSLANSSWDHALAERSEDVIFGELITAMLKKMDDDKRRIVKKEIINLLLT